MKKKILIVEDDPRLAESLACEFSDHNYEVLVAVKLSDIPRASFDFAVLDMRLSGGEFGLDAIDIVKRDSSNCKMVVLSGYGSIATAVEAVKRGAIDYLTKPANFKMIESALLGNRGPFSEEMKEPSLSQIEHEYIDFVLTKNDGNITKTARALGLHRQSLQRKLKKYT